MSRAPIKRTVKTPGQGAGKWRLPPSGRLAFDTPVTPSDTPKGGMCSVLSTKRKGGPRKNCPVQLIFQNGTPYLRLCTAPKQPGKLVRLPYDGAKAQEIAAKVCRHWESDKKFERWTDHEGLGRVLRRR